jgi:hypothetical protein
MKHKNTLLILAFAVLALTSLQGPALALDLRLAAGDGSELFIRKANIQFIQKANGKLRIGTLAGNFEITPLIITDKNSLPINELRALSSAIDELLELEEPRTFGELRKELNDLEAAGENNFTRYRMFMLSLFRGNNDTLQCGAIEQL